MGPGIGVALITPFTEQLAIDWAALARLLQRVAASEVDYLVVQGTTGESVTTTAAEKKELLRFVATHNPRKLPIVYGLGGSHTTALCQELATIDLRHVVAVLSVTPYYNRPSQEGLYQHYNALADASPVPLLLYNVPKRTGVNLDACTTLRLSQHAHIVGIKEASGHLGQCMDIFQDKPQNFALIAGDDALTLPLFALGATGAISVLANALPVEFSQLVHKALHGDHTTARRLHYQLLSFFRLIEKWGNPAGIKALLAALDICQPYTRPPLQTVSEDALQEARHVLARNNMGV